MTMKNVKSFAQKVKEQASKKAAEETKAASNPELSKLQQELRAKEIELARTTKKLAEVEKLRVELEQFREQTTKERITSALRAELAKTAKKLNVTDSALDDVVGLLENKFQYTPEGKVLPVVPEGSEPVEAEQFVAQWLEGKSHFVAPPPAQPAGIKPAPQGPKATQPAQNAPVLSAAAMNQRLGVEALYKK